MSSREEPNRISISRDALRADLAEMELRLRVWIGEQMLQKADVKALDLLTARIVRIEEKGSTLAQSDAKMLQDARERLDILDKRMHATDSGDFSSAQDRALRLLMDETLKEHTDIGWTNRQRWIAVIALFVAVFSVIASVYIAVHFARPIR